MAAGVKQNGKIDVLSGSEMIEIDDKEFDIPPVNEEPTLEEILSTPDDDLPLLDYSIPNVAAVRASDEERESVSSQESSLSDRTRTRIVKRTEQHYAIVRHIILKKISCQLDSAADRLSAGSPTALAVSSHIAVGTLHGLVFVFGAKQELKWCLSSVAAGAQFGFVSALSFNVDCSRLLCAFAKGQVMMWDLTNGRLLRSINNAHFPNAGVVHVKFTDDRSLAVACDSQGSVFELKFQHRIGVRTSDVQCLFSGTRGEICAVEPLRLQNVLPDAVDKELELMAMASLSKVLIVAIRPQLKVCGVRRLGGEPTAVTLLAWQCIYVQAVSCVKPSLAVAKDQNVKIVCVSCEDVNNVQVIDFKDIQLSYKVMSISWIHPHTMIAIDPKETAHVFDLHSEEELELIDLSKVQLVYDLNFYQLPEENIESEDVDCPVKRVCYQSACTTGGQLILLGSKGIHVLTIRSWASRIDLLVRHGCYEAALDLAQSFYNGTAKAVLELHGNKEERRKQVAERILSLLDSYVDLAMTRMCPAHGKLEELEMHYLNTVSICVDHCLQIGRIDFLYGKVYERFAEDVTAKGVFLDCLEPYIIKDELTHVTPQVMKDFLEHYEGKGLLASIEACIVHLDLANLDLKQVLSHCWEHGLYDALLYIYNQGLHDYVTPVNRLLCHLTEALSAKKQLTPEQVQLGNKTLVYISCCLSGRSYPLGDIPQDLIAPVRDGVLGCLTVKRLPENCDTKTEFPYLRTLINFDAREFFNVLELAFEVDGFELEKKQRLVDRILKLMVEDPTFSPVQFGALFTFLARQMARKERSIDVNQVLFDQVLESLCVSRDDSRHEERQQALIELLGTDHLKHFQPSRLVTLAESAHFFRVCETLHAANRDFHLVLPCYWRDTARQRKVFDYIQNILAGKDLSAEEKVRVREKALDGLEQLVRIDSHDSAKLVLNGYIGKLPVAVKQLVNKDDEFYEFLHDVFELHEVNPEGVDAVVKELDLEPEVLEKYVELMCQKIPQEVLRFLKSNEGYRVEEAMDICQRYQVEDALVYLREKAGDVAGAFALPMLKLQKHLEKVFIGGQVTETEEAVVLIIQILQRNSYKVTQSQRESLWFSLLEVIMGVQERLRLSLRTEEVTMCSADRSVAKTSVEVKPEFHSASVRKTDGVLATENASSSRLFAASIGNSTLEALNRMMRHVVDAMITYIPLQIVLQRVLRNPAYVSGTFGEMKDLFLGMLESSTYEKELIQTCAVLVGKNIHDQMKGLVDAASRGVHLSSDLCSLCSKTLSTLTDKETIVCFQCGHSFHYVCLAEAGAVEESPRGRERRWKCCICDRHHRPGMKTCRRKSSESSALAPKCINPTQVLAFDCVRRTLKSPGRLQTLLDLKTSRRSKCNPLFENERYALRLSAPPPPP